MQLFPKILSAFAIASLSAIPLASRPAMADTFNFTYSGDEFSNSASATGTIDLDMSLFNNPGTTSTLDVPFVNSFNIIISGASSGNGSFDLTDYAAADGGEIEFNTNKGTLDFTQELIGQPTDGNPWGSSSFDSGDFNIFTSTVGANVGAPYGALGNFIIGADNGYGDLMRLTSFSPSSVTVTPEPSTNAALGLGVVGIGGLMIASRKRRKTTA